MNDGGLTVLALQGENVKRVKAVRIVPTSPTGLVKVSGKNGQGKSSTLDLIMFALAGARQHPAMPLRKGTKAGKDVLELQDLKGQPVYRITRTWTDKDSYLTVERIGVGKVARPRELMDAMIGAGLGFDPGEFIRLKPAKQVDTLLGLVSMAEDPRTLDAQRRAAYDERTAVHREVKQLEGQLAALLEPEGDIPTVEVSIATLTEEYQRRVAEQSANEGQRRALTAAIDAHAVTHAEVVRLEEALVTARANLLALTGVVVVGRARVEALTDPDVEAAAATMRDAEGVNVAIRARHQRARVVEELDSRKGLAAGLTATIDELDTRKARLLAEAPFPIPGLGFEAIAGEYAVTMHGVPLADAAESERMVVGMAIAMACNPQVRVILIREASLLDADTLAAIERLAGERGYQIWCEIVGDGDADSFVISDGGVLSGPTRAGTPTTTGAALPW